MTDTFNGIRGYFKIEAIKDGKVIDTFEKHNLIMDEARNIFAKMLANINGQPVVDKFVLGNCGHVGADANDPSAGDILVPKGETDGFTSDRTMLFAEETGVLNTNYTFIDFTVDGVSGNTVTASDGVSTVTTTVTGNEVEYIIDIDNNAMNIGSGSIVYTECAFYAGSEIFSMRTFKGKIKDNTVGLRVTWRIIF